MNKWEKDIHELMKLYGHKVRETPADPETLKDELESALRYRLIEEESQELLEAIEITAPLEDIAKEIIDVLVVTIGCATAYGIPLDEVWDIVHKSNMAKGDGPFDPDTGKKLKPEGWIDPKQEIKKLLFPSDPSPCPWCKKIPEIGRPTGILKGRYYSCISKHCPVSDWSWIDVKEWEKVTRPPEDKQRIINQLMDDRWDLIP